MIIEEPLNGLKVITPNQFGDSRGFFLETWQKRRYNDIGITEEFVQDNWSRSTKGVLRGLHYQISKPQGKLVSVRSGTVYDVAVDIRKDSPSFGEWYGAILSVENKKQMYVPPGFAHGFLVISEIADFEYKCTEYYDPKDEGGIIWNDEILAIDWGKYINIQNVVISEKDKRLNYFEHI